MILLDLVRDYRDNVQMVEDPASKRIFSALVHHAECSLRAGVRMTLTEFAGLSVLERLAFVKAGDQLRAFDAQRIGMASSSLIGAAAVTADHDDGDALELLMIDATHARVVAES